VQAQEKYRGGLHHAEPSPHSFLFGVATLDYGMYSGRGLFRLCPTYQKCIPAMLCTEFQENYVQTPSEIVVRVSGCIALLLTLVLFLLLARRRLEE
jgi:hypothetical protein